MSTAHDNASTEASTSQPIYSGPMTMMATVANGHPPPIITTGEGIMSPVQMAPACTTLPPAQAIARRSDGVGRVVQRVFVGAMPVAVVPPPLPKPPERGFLRRRTSTLPLSPSLSLQSEDPDLSNIDDRHVFHFFLSRGGKEEDWTREANLSIRREILSKWREAGWATVRRRENEGTSAPSTKWVGHSFEIGKDLAMGVRLDEIHSLKHTAGDISASTPMTAPISADKHGPSAVADHSGQSSSVSLSLAKDDSSLTGLSSATNRQQDDSAATPNSEMNPRISSSSNRPLLSNHRIHSAPSKAPQPDGSRLTKSRSDSPLPLIESPDDTGEPVKPALKKRIAGSFAPPRDIGKTKTVAFPDISRTPSEHSKTPQAQDHRTISASSADAPGTQTHRDDTNRTESRAMEVVHGTDQPFFLRDRMLVRVGHTRQIVRSYNETNSRVINDLTEDGWREILVVWHENRLELYRDRKTPGAAYVSSTKHLSFVIPLTPSTAKFSIFSFTDMTFSIASEPTKFHPHSRSLLKLFHSDIGTDIFVFKHLSRSRATDWAWHLWRRLGGEIPSFIEVHCPALDTKIQIDLPIVDDSVIGGWKSFTRKNIINLCEQSLSKIPDYRLIMGNALLKGREFGLAWRRGPKLDWVWLDEDIDGTPRDWAALYGLALRTSGAMARLEIHLGEYIPTKLKLDDKTQLEEPPAVEGYAWRIKPISQARALVYISTHDGYVFISPSSKAHIPQPPAGPGEDIELAAENSSHETETRRGTAQILSSSVMMDIRNISVVRRASKLANWTLDAEAVKTSRNIRSTVSGENFDLHTANVEYNHDEDDEGGEESLAKSSDKPLRRLGRSFELVFRSGQVVRFETYSCKIASEWISRMQKLVSYWTKKHRLDARQEMELLQVASGSPNAFNHGRRRSSDDAWSYLCLFWNWSVLFAKRPIIRCGRVFFRKGIRGQYRLRQLVLVSGHLMTFQISSSGVYRKRKTLNLLDTYVCSGQFATKELDVSTNSDHYLGRRYQDGLECADAEDDRIFVLWHVSHPVSRRHTENKDDQSTPQSYKRPKLSTKRKIWVIKARSAFERDAWCWALNCELERIARVYSDSERTL